jgi:TolB-like protein
MSRLGEAVASLQDALRERYTIERELGRGGMAAVYLARDLRHDRTVALKVLDPEVFAVVGPARFQREIRLACRLSHPHIVPVFDSGEAAGRLWYSMPYVDGESLRDRLLRESQLPLPDAIRIAGQVAGALDYAHEQGVVHRDVKPENILLAAGDQAVLADLGIAGVLDAGGEEKLTVTGLSLGTPAYMSPEQAAGACVQARSDVYALGCVVYEMLAGTPPFTGSSAQAVLARHAVDPVPPLHTVRPTLPAGVASAVERALAKVPADRYATAGEFSAALVTVGRPWRPWRAAVLPRRAGVLLVVGAVMVSAGIGAVTLGRSASPTILPAGSSIAVLPFRPSGDDSALARLGRELAIAVSASLDGVGGITTADRVRVARETAERPVETPEQVAALARRLGARSVLYGTSIRDGDRVRLDFGLYDAGDHRPLGEGITLLAHRDSLMALSDSVSWEILRQVWRRGKPPTTSLAAVTTRSLPALRAFLEGERAVENEDWNAATLAYRSAIAADTTFALAYFGYWITRYWSGEEVDFELPDSSYLDRLPQRERLLAEAFAVSDSLTLELERYREITRRYHDYWPGWFLLGDRLHHVGLLLGYDRKDAQSALKAAVTLNPRLRPAWDHLFVNSLGHDTAATARALAQWARSAMTEPGRLQRRRLLRDVAAAGGVIGPSLVALADSIAERRAKESEMPQHADRFPAYFFVFSGFPAAQVDFDRRLMGFGATARIAAAHLWGTAWSWAQRGAWDSALGAMRHAVALEPNPPGDGGPMALDEYAMAVFGAWLGQVPAVEASVRRPRARAIVAGLTDAESRRNFGGLLAWYDGLLAFSQRDRRGLDSAREDARRSGHPNAEIIELSLAAVARALNGDRAGAGRDLANLEWRCANRWDCGHSVTLYMAVHRMAAATWLLEAGDTAQAGRLLTWTEAQIGGGLDVSFTHAASPLAYLMRARIAEAQGDLRSATEHYHQFLRRYDSPLPPQRHLVDEARGALARLAGLRDPQ